MGDPSANATDDGSGDGARPDGAASRQVARPDAPSSVRASATVRTRQAAVWHDLAQTVLRSVLELEHAFGLRPAELAFGPGGVGVCCRFEGSVLEAPELVLWFDLEGTLLAVEGRLAASAPGLFGALLHRPVVAEVARSTHPL